MTLIEVRELLDYWHRHPPLHLLIGAALRGRDAAKPSQDFAALMALAPNGFLAAKGRS